MPMTAKARHERDVLILQMFLEGYSQRAIAGNSRVNLSPTRVNVIIRRELARVARDHTVRDENALTIYQARLEMLVKAAMTQVADGELKAITEARRLLEQVERLYGFADADMGYRGERTPPANDDNEAEDSEPAKIDDLNAYRALKEAALTT